MAETKFHTENPPHEAGSISMEDADVQEEEEKMVQYEVEDVPPWYLWFFLGLQVSCSCNNNQKQGGEQVPIVWLLPIKLLYIIWKFMGKRALQSLQN